MSVRTAILEGTSAARRLHEQFDCRALVKSGVASSIDVFGIAERLGATLLFRRLEGLLGAYMAQPSPGILVSTARGLHTQRFTGAHEIGHMVLNHDYSLDAQVGRQPSRDVMDLREVAADAFASELLLPSWLLVHHAARHNWRETQLATPETVYQLSLRVGASFEATCWALQGHNFISRDVGDRLRSAVPKNLKIALLPDGVSRVSPWGDVWDISEYDNEARLEGGPDDLLVLRYTERSSAGYLWDEQQLSDQGLQVLDDRYSFAGDAECGGVGLRVMIVRVKEAGSYNFSLAERRPWQPSAVARTATLALDLHGKEVGLSRSARRALVAA